MEKQRKESLEAVLQLCGNLGAEIRYHPEYRYFTAMVWTGWDTPCGMGEALAIQQEIQRTAAQYPTVVCYCFDPFSTLVYVNLCLAISAQAIAQRSTVMRKTHSDNELFTFRVWLVRLGLNGEEFKHTRDHLLANLDGDRAWRFDKDSYAVNKKKKKSREMER